MNKTFAFLNNREGLYYFDNTRNNFYCYLEIKCNL